MMAEYGTISTLAHHVADMSVKLRPATKGLPFGAAAIWLAVQAGEVGQGIWVLHQISEPS